MTIELLRPQWLLLLIPLTILCWLLWKNQRLNRNWASVIDERLLPHLLSGKVGQRRRLWPVFLWFVLSLLVLIVLAAPVWEKLPLPVFKQNSALVIALDLSRSMNAEDIKPSRLSRARLKLKDLLNARTEGQTALIAYAATAYTVSPLTDDTDTINSLVSSLDTDIMPAQGSRADLAIEKALALFENAAVSRGDMLLITDGISNSMMETINAMDFKKFNLSILSVGSRQGAPIPLSSGGFVKDKNGSIVIAKTDADVLRILAASHSGVYSPISINDADLEKLQAMLQSSPVSSELEQTEFKTDRWRELAPWLLLLVTPLAALAFRRGLFLSLWLAVLLLPQTDPVQAADGFEWQHLWKNQNQRAQQALENGQAEQAAELFNQSDWKAAALYKAGQYEQALQQLQGQQSADGLYNRANALAKMGRLQQALDSYDQVLQQEQDHEDATHNRKLVEQALKQQQQQQQNDSDQDKQNNEQGQQGEQEQQKNKNQQGQPDQQADSGQQDSTSQPDQQDQSSANQQQSEEQSDQEQQQQSAQQQADQKNQPGQDNAKDQQTAEQSDDDAANDLSQQVEEQWLRRIPDDPGGLLRNKFRYQYSQQQPALKENEPW